MQGESTMYENERTLSDIWTSELERQYQDARDDDDNNNITDSQLWEETLLNSRY